MEDEEKQLKLAIEARTNSVKQLAELYRVVISIAVGVAFHNIVDQNAKPIPLRTEQLVLFAAFIVTVVPFFHGAVRHLFATYIEVGGSSRVKNWVVLVDYYLLFIGGGLFIGLASTFSNTLSFLMVYSAILCMDIVWGILSNIGFGGTQSQHAEVSWAKINLVTLIVAILLYLFDAPLRALGLSENNMQLIVGLIALVRSCVDYYHNHEFYCPPYPTPNTQNPA